MKLAASSSALFSVLALSLGSALFEPSARAQPPSDTLKILIDQQTAQFGLLVAGKAAWDAGDFATAAANWEALLRGSRIAPEVGRAVQEWAVEARRRTGSQSKPISALPVSEAPPPPVPASASPAENSRPAGSAVTVSGVVLGGGKLGPGGTVVWLKRASGKTPKPAPNVGRVVRQVNKAFVPRVLPVTIGSRVDFRNGDDIFHNVFSLSKPNDFDAGLFKTGQSYTRTFTKPGPVQLLCNIHSSMLGYVVVVDTPYYSQADSTGAFSIRGVPPAEYDVTAWHEGSTQPWKSRVNVDQGGVRGLQVRVSGNRRVPTSLPDKYGKARQAQLGY
jgi:plastocyanin